MSGYKKILISSIWETLLSVIFFVVTGILFIQAAKTEGIAGFGIALIGITSCLAGAIFIAPVIASLIAVPASNIFYPDEHFDRPQPMYSVPEGKRKSGRCREAFAGFQKIAAEYPQEVKPYIEMIDIAVVDMKNKKLADDVFHLGIATLEDKNSRDTLAKIYKAVGSRLENIPPPSQPPIPLRRRLAATELL